MVAAMFIMFNMHACVYTCACTCMCECVHAHMYGGAPTEPYLHPPTPRGSIPKSVKMQ